MFKLFLPFVLATTFITTECDSGESDESLPPNPPCQFSYCPPDRGNPTPYPDQAPDPYPNQ